MELPQSSAEHDKWRGRHFSLLIGQIKHQYIKFCVLIKFSHLRSLIGDSLLANMSFHFPAGCCPWPWWGLGGRLGSGWHPSSLPVAYAVEGSGSSVAPHCVFTSAESLTDQGSRSHTHNKTLSHTHTNLLGHTKQGLQTLFLSQQHVERSMMGDSGSFYLQRLHLGSKRK